MSDRNPRSSRRAEAHVTQVSSSLKKVLKRKGCKPKNPWSLRSKYQPTRSLEGVRKTRGENAKNCKSSLFIFCGFSDSSKRLKMKIQSCNDVPRRHSNPKSPYLSNGDEQRIVAYSLTRIFASPSPLSLFIR